MPRIHFDTALISRFPVVHLPGGGAKHTIHGIFVLEFQSRDKATCDKVVKVCMAALEASGMVPPPGPIPPQDLEAAILDEAVPESSN